MAPDKFDFYLAQRRMDEGMFWEHNEDSLDLIADMLLKIECDWMESDTDEVSGGDVAKISRALHELMTRRTIARRAFQEANKADEMTEIAYVREMACPEHRRTVLVTLAEEKKEAKK